MLERRTGARGWRIGYHEATHTGPYPPTMARIHTHYDNLKVARKAPQEVIRAAYKALSQKYHPDKNPGDVKAARIMAILNSAYGTLADPVRRHEHDEWIAAEEWEIEWLESTRAEEGRELLRNESPQWEPELIDDAVTPRLRRNPAWWFSLGLCLALGCVAGILLMSRTKALPAAVGGLLGAKADAAAIPALSLPAPRRDDPMLDGWAVSQAHQPDAAPLNQRFMDKGAEGNFKVAFGDSKSLIRNLEPIALNSVHPRGDDLVNGDDVEVDATGLPARVSADYAYLLDGDTPIGRCELAAPLPLAPGERAQFRAGTLLFKA